MKEFLKKLIVGVLLIICIGLNFEKSNIIADEWSESVKFYNSYGNSAVFKATNIYEGDIYFCSADLSVPLFLLTDCLFVP